MGAVTAFLVAAWLAWMTPTWMGWREPTNTEAVDMHHLLTLLAGLLACFIICTVVAFLAMRNDWGWKSRY
jgi:hypothetical protein